jgi:hypothetical protein
MLDGESDREISLLTRLPWWIIFSRKLQERRDDLAVDLLMDKNGF